MTFRGPIAQPITENEYPLVFGIITNALAPLEANDIVTEGNRLTFKTSFRQSRKSIGLIDNAVFEVQQNGQEMVLSYHFTVYRLLAITAVLGIFMAFVSKVIFFGLVCFVCLGGGNCVYYYIKHRKMFKNIITEINQLLLSKMQKQGLHT